MSNFYHYADIDPDIASGFSPSRRENKESGHRSGHRVRILASPAINHPTRAEFELGSREYQAISPFLPPKRRESRNGAHRDGIQRTATTYKLAKMNESAKLDEEIKTNLATLGYAQKKGVPARG